MRRILISFLLTIVSVCGCANATRIQTAPPGATVFVNGKFVGLSPTLYTVPRVDWKPPYKYRIESDGYLPLEGQLRTGPLGGRITGMIFTLGIVALFKTPDGFQDHEDFLLARDPAKVVPPNHRAGSTESIEDRLDRARRLRDQGLITDKEYEQQKDDILRDL